MVYNSWRDFIENLPYELSDNIIKYLTNNNFKIINKYYKIEIKDIYHDYINQARYGDEFPLDVKNFANNAGPYKYPLKIMYNIGKEELAGKGFDCSNWPLIMYN